jgi:two-component system, cell cycle response regulator
MSSATEPFAASSDKPMRALVAEDNPVFQTMLRNMLAKWGYDPIVARDGNEAWRILECSDSPRLAILDWMMPGLDGVELCRRVRASRSEPYLYVLLLTARTQAQDLVEGMEAGADDYLTKPFNVHELRVRLRAGRRIIELQEELMRAREALREQATHDALTGLLNRAAVRDALRNELERAGREGHPVTLMIADLDHFKHINDTYGHLAGDYVLSESARRMKSAIRRYDSMGRYGGEEFLIVVPGCDCATGRTQAERLRAVLAAEPFAAENASFQVTCSVGVACTAGGAGQASLDALLRAADLALYDAKNGGRNRVETRPAESNS